jgi:hypothetical protein
MSSLQTDAGRWVRHGGNVIVLLDPSPRSTREASSAAETAAWAHETYSYGTTHWIQSSLNRIMGRTLAVDGAIGPQTRAAIMDFQRSEGLAVDGIVGPNTTAALQAALARLPTRPSRRRGRRRDRPEGCPSGSREIRA